MPPTSRSRQFNPYDGWGIDSRGREVNSQGQHKIVGWGPNRIPARGFGGLNEYNLLQNSDAPAKDVANAAQEARKAGVLINKDGQRMADTWGNRGFTTSRSSRSPYPEKPQGGPTQDQQRWAGAAAKKLEAGDGQAPKQAAVGADVPWAGGMAPATKSRATAANPYSREGNIANAKAAGEFDDVRSNYNSDIRNRGYNMDEKGTINPMSKEDDGTGTSPFARARFGAGAEEIRARRDFAKGEAPVRFTDPNIGPNADEMNMRPIRAEKINPYGTATATLTPDGSPAIGGRATMPDPLTGKTVPMKQWAADQSAVQATKYGAGRDASGNLIDGPSASQAGKEYFNPSKVPLGQDDAEQYRKIARGGKMTGGKSRV